MKTLPIGIVFTCAAIPARAQSPDPEEREAYRRGYEEGFARGYRKGLEVAYRCGRLDKTASANECN